MGEGPEHDGKNDAQHDKQEDQRGPKRRSRTRSNVCRIDGVRNRPGESREHENQDEHENEPRDNPAKVDCPRMNHLPLAVVGAIRAPRTANRSRVHSHAPHIGTIASGL